MPDEILGLSWIIEAYYFLSTQRNLNGFIDYKIINTYCFNKNLDVNILSKYLFEIDAQIRSENG
jgi:hypothetical protein